MKFARAFAPATVANVCCGFDILGFAIDDHGDEVEVRLSDSPGVKMIKITGDDGKLPLEPGKNTCSVAVQSYLNALGKQVDVDIILNKNLPLGSGMGSSAASAASFPPVSGVHSSKAIIISAPIIFCALIEISGVKCNV